MTPGSPRISRRALGASVAAAAGLAGLALTPSAHATPDLALGRIAGADRIETAADTAIASFPGGATEALIARADDFPDALAGNYLAGAVGAPILLADPDDVPQATMVALDELGVTDVTLLGGTSALDTAVESELTDAGITVARTAGDDRYQTAAEIATSQDPATVGETSDGRTALLATGEGFADALTGGPASYAANLPLLLTPGDELGDDAAAALGELEIAHVVILGGTEAVARRVELELLAQGVTSERLAGDTRYDTATAIAAYATANLGFVDTTVNVATGAAFPDALTGGPHAGEESAPILLANEGNTAEACTFFEGIADTLASGHVLGGSAAVPDQLVADLEECGGAVSAGSNQTFTATTGRGDVIQEPGTGRSFAFGDVGADEVQLALAECADVTDTAGTITFTAASGNADLGTVAATIITVNGAPALPPGQQTTGTPEEGAVELTVLGQPDTEECFIVVAFADANGDGALAVDSSGAPTEDFGITGSTTFAAADAGGGAQPPTLPLG